MELTNCRCELNSNMQKSGRHEGLGFWVLFRRVILGFYWGSIGGILKWGKLY